MAVDLLKVNRYNELIWSLVYLFYYTNHRFQYINNLIFFEARHRDGKVDEPLALVEILKEIDYSDVAPSIRKWLPQVKK